MWRDYQRGGRIDCPEFLRDFILDDQRRPKLARSLAPPRQARHLV
jgi:hypothetical protein